MDSSDTARTSVSAEPVHLVQLVALVERQAERIAEQAALIAMGQERARVLVDQLALAAPAPSESVHASNLTPETGNPTPEPSRRLPWPRPPTPNIRVLAPWLVLAVILITAAVVGWGPAWRW